MRKPSYWITLITVTILLNASLIESSIKINEVGGTTTLGVFCGDQIIDLYYQVCTVKRRRRSPVMQRREAKSFMDSQTSTMGAYNIVEECCNESCATEEMREYC